MEYDRHAYETYMNGVLDGSITANEYIRLACKRMNDWKSRDDIYFDEDDVQRRINFIYKLKHTTGHHNGKNFELLPWQQFVIANIFGWKWKSNDLRVTRNVFIMISRKNGKTALASAIGLAALVGDREQDSEIDMIANNAKQAGLCFKHTKNFVESVDPSHALFKIYRGEIRMPALKSNIQVLSSDSMGLDGYSASVVIFDEMHAQKNWDLYNVMKSSQGARQQPLMIVLTTAGFLVGEAYPCYSMWENCISILRGDKEDDSQFSAIYQLDIDDDYHDEDVWLKCSPSLNQTVFKSFMEDEVKAADNNASLEVGVKTKTFNMWCQSSDVWLQYNLLKQYSEPIDLKELAERDLESYAYVGVDLGSVSDLTAVSVMIKSEGKYYFKTYIFVPEETLETGMNALKYREWANNKYIIVTEGNVQDYDYILRKIIEIDNIIQIRGIFYDTWNAVSWATDATTLGLPLFPYSQSLGNFNRPTKEFERLLKKGDVVIDYNPVVLWCFGNSTLKSDFNDNCKPTKADAHSGKIDAVISMLEALGGYYLDVGVTPDMTAL